ncbi:MAG TPA: cation-translocating P-type ATPase [Acidimicrobiales bacterium]|nr:cation-translocating P-type ATPase [Acidimicrobiales bacterium]
MAVTPAVPSLGEVPSPRGLTGAEVAARVAAGQVNAVEVATTRTIGQIVRANVVTRFNAILGSLLVVILVVGPLRDALFGIVLVTNTVLGIVQEVRAKRTLDRLALLSAPRARVVRDGSIQEIAVGAVVVGDLVVIGTGDQIVVDGPVVEASELDVDESLLTGESEPVGKRQGDELLSGSFVASGAGRYRAARVGADAYARQVTARAKEFALVRSELRTGIDSILRVVTWLLLPAAVLLVASQLVSHETLPDAIRGSVGGVGSMIPEGLVLLTTVAFAAGVARLGRRNVLIQELAALEGLARVDVVCTDKTGTLTEAAVEVSAVIALGGAPETEIGVALATVVAADPDPNATLRAVAAHLGAADAGSPPPAIDAWPVTGRVAFSSRRKWAAVDAGAHGALVFGAPDVVLAAEPTPEAAAVLVRAGEEAARGRRTLLLGRLRSLPVGGELDGVEPLALVVLEEKVRADAYDTLAYFAEEGVAVVLLSGDHPRTVGAVAARLDLTDAEPVDARDLPASDADLAAVVLDARAVGRITPDQKERTVRALQASGHTVAMVGDGVNDVLALKAADIGIAMGSGTPATRGVARVVLVDDRFAELPAVVAEGRRVIANVERVANLFVTKTVYALVLALAIGVALVPFPFLPRQLTIVSSLTIGIPAFFLALAPSAQRPRPGFVGRVLRFAVPSGLVASAATLSSYALARSDPSVTLAEARTTATLTLFAVALWVLVLLARPLTDLRELLIWAMAIAFLVALAVPGLRAFFGLDLPRLEVLLAAVGVLAVADAALEVGWRAANRLSRWWRERTLPKGPPVPTG